MLRGFTAALATFMFLFVAMPASAEDFFGHVECGSGGGAGCDVEAESTEELPDEAPDPGGDSGGDEPCTAAADEPPPCEGDASLMQCTAYVGGDEDEEEEGVDLVEVAHQARASLELDEPRVSMSPSADGPVLVHVPVWMWIDQDQWSPQSASASVPGGEVTVTAAPSSVSWQMGDGTTVDCEGPGTPFDAFTHDPEESSPDCGHTYTSTGQVEVSAQITWETSWESDDGEGGSLPSLTTETSQQVEVIESSGVVT